MAVESLVNVSSDLVGGLISQVGSVALWLQAVGVVLIIWIIFDIVNLVLNYKRKKYLKEMHNLLKKLDKKVDLLIKSKKK